MLKIHSPYRRVFFKLKYTMTKIDKNTVAHIAHLANIPVNDQEKTELANGFNKTLEVVDELFKVDVSNIKATHQVTGLENILRDDEVNQDKMLSQNEAIKNAKKTHNGYFAVDQVLNQE